jgi:hypothetical protein
VFLDKLGHYTVEPLIALTLGVRAAGGVAEIHGHLGFPDQRPARADLAGHPGAV